MPRIFVPVLALLIVFAGCTAPRSNESWSVAYESWATLLRKANEDVRAETMNAKVTKLRNVSSTESTHLGFNPAADLKEYAAELRKLSRESRAIEMETLAKRWEDKNYKAYLRHLK